MSAWEDYFSSDYLSARERFVEAASAAGADVSRHDYQPNIRVSGSDVELSVDVASVGEGADLVVVSCGLHGIEGFLGSAVQLALLKRWCVHPPSCRVLLIHAMNPWGFHHCRRVDENNVDLNRNYPTGGYHGAPEGYHRLHTLLNPDNAHRGRDFFKLRAVAKIARYGMQPLKAAVASGQYEYPEGLFFGGHTQCPSTRLIADNMEAWIGSSSRVFHADIHTGLGKYARCKLLIPQSDDGRINQWCRNAFKELPLETHGKDSATSYPVNGMLGDWLLSEFNDRPYYFIGAELGTYSPVSVLQSLRDENRQHFYGDPQSAEFAASKKNLLESFCPGDVAWRRRSVAETLTVIDSASMALSGISL